MLSLFLTMFSFYSSPLIITFLNTIEIWSESLGSISLIMGRKFGETNKLEKEGLLHEDAGGTGYVTFYQIFTYHVVKKNTSVWFFRHTPISEMWKWEKKVYSGCWKQSFSKFKCCPRLDVVPVFVELNLWVVSVIIILNW